LNFGSCIDGVFHGVGPEIAMSMVLSPWDFAYEAAASRSPDQKRAVLGAKWSCFSMSDTLGTWWEDVEGELEEEDLTARRTRPGAEREVMRSTRHVISRQRESAFAYGLRPRKTESESERSVKGNAKMGSKRKKTERTLRNVRKSNILPAIYEDL